MIQGRDDTVEKKCICEKYFNQSSLCIEWLCPRNAFQDVQYFVASPEFILQFRKNTTTTWIQSERKWDKIHTKLLIVSAVTMLISIVLYLHRLRKILDPQHRQQCQIPQISTSHSEPEPIHKIYQMKSPQQLEDERVMVFSSAYRAAYPSIKRISL